MRELRVSLAACGESLQSLLAFGLVSIPYCKIDDPHDHDQVPKAGQALPQNSGGCFAWPGSLL